MTIFDINARFVLVGEGGIAKFTFLVQYYIYIGSKFRNNLFYEIFTIKRLFIIVVSLRTILESATKI